MNPDSQLNAEKCLALLSTVAVGTLSTLNPDGSPYAVPVHFVLLDDKVHIHCGYHGQKLENMRRDDRVCFTAWEMNGYTNPENPSPCKTGTDYKCVAISGTAAIVADATKKRALLRRFAAKYAPEKDADNMPEEAICRTCLVEINGKMTGKQRG
jgi:nitroimidazol reductase NimA-like FMN-containing flavoprotein (pyridoxamine 5'-phosphate oxidase superfamily)